MRGVASWALADAAASLLLGAACAGCGRPGLGLCAACAAELARPEPRAVADAGVWAAAAYAGVWRAALVAHKERHARHLARPLGEALAVAVAASLGGRATRLPVVLVPIPSRAAAVRERGLDVTDVLARRAARVLAEVGLPCRVERALTLARGVADQGDLGEAARWANLAHGMAARRCRSGTVVVVDDITTTGATLAAARAAFRRAGHPDVTAAVVAATPRRDGRRTTRDAFP